MAARHCVSPIYSLNALTINHFFNERSETYSTSPIHLRKTKLADYSTIKSPFSVMLCVSG